MNNKKLFLITIIIISIIFLGGFAYSQINLKKLATSVEESEDKNVDIDGINSIYDAGSSTIAKISDLNKSTKPLDSNSGNTATSNLELNYREIVKLNKSNLDSSNSDFTYMGYPRLKKLTNSSDGYNYFLTFQNTRKDYDNGTHIYYACSADLIKWEGCDKNLKDNDKPKILFEGEEHNNPPGAVRYSSADSLVLKDGKIMVVAAKVLYGVYNYSAKQFNATGIYVKYSDNNGKTWSDEKQIYAGLVWEPSIVQTSTGEIQVFFTSVAPVAYLNGKVKSTKNEFDVHANTSIQFQSTGVAMISSTDGGVTWTPNITGTTKKYVDLNRNPYVAYIVAQQYVRTKQTNSVANFKGLYAYNASVNDKQLHFGINYNKETLIKMTDQMPVVIELNNKKKMVMALETVKVHMEDQPGLDVQVTKPSHTISLAYSNAQEVEINGKKKEKYWLDINKNTKTSFNSEKDVYNNEGLGLTTEGPIAPNKVNDIVLGAAPYVLQFPSGETLLYYSSSDKDSDTYSYPTLIIGNENGEFKAEKAFAPYKKDKESIFGSISQLSSHSVALLYAPRIDNRYIGILPLYLNHTIDVKNEDLSSTNDDALFIGSDSQAQATIRATYDNDNIYFTVDRLDNDLTDKDLIGLYINSNNLKYNGKNYDYLHFNFNHKKLGIVELVKGNTTINVKGVSYKLVTVNNSKDNYGGYKVTITVPRKTFNLTDASTAIKLCAVLNNVDGNSSTINDMMTGTDIKNRDTWIKLNLVPQSTNNSLKSLSLSSGTLSPAFNANTTSYTATVNDSSVTINATKGDSYQTITGTGKMQLQYGTNTFKIEVTSQSGSKKIYTIVITRPKDNSGSGSSNNNNSSNNKLSGLSLSSGILSPAFNANTTSYTATVNDSSVTINATKGDSYQTITGTGKMQLQYGTNTFKIEVTSQSGSKKIYTIVITRPKDNSGSGSSTKNSNNYLKSLSIEPGNILFNKDVLEYKISVDNNITKLTINATAEDTKAKINIDNPSLKIGINTITVTVTAENGQARTYKIIVKRLEAQEKKSDNNNIKSLKISGYSIGFKPNVLEYDLTINDEKQLTIDVILDDKNASYVIEGNQKLKNGSTIKIKTLSESGLKKEYIINISVKNNSKENNSEENEAKEGTIKRNDSKMKVTTVVIISVSIIAVLIYLYYKTQY